MMFKCQLTKQQPLQDVFEDDSDVHIVMELCEGGSLTDMVNSGQLRDERDIARIISAVLRFIAQCHAKGIVYRDCKLDNFLFVSKDPAAPLKATDFGLSIRHTAGEQPLTSRSGTPAYMAPEVCFRPFIRLFLLSYLSPLCLCYCLFSCCSSLACGRLHLCCVGRVGASRWSARRRPRLSSACLPTSATCCWFVGERASLSPRARGVQVIMQSYGAKSDLWSVGMVTYQLLTGRFPFCDNIRNCSLQDVWKAILTESGRMGRHLDKLEQVWNHHTIFYMHVLHLLAYQVYCRSSRWPVFLKSAAISYFESCCEKSQD